MPIDSRSITLAMVRAFGDEGRDWNMYQDMISNTFVIKTKAGISRVSARVLMASDNPEDWAKAFRLNMVPYATKAFLTTPTVAAPAEDAGQIDVEGDTRIEAPKAPGRQIEFD